MSHRDNGKLNKELSRLEELVTQTQQSIKQARARASHICGRLADERSAPDAAKEDG